MCWPTIKTFLTFSVLSRKLSGPIVAARLNASVHTYVGHCAHDRDHKSQEDDPDLGTCGFSVFIFIEILYL